MGVAGTYTDWPRLPKKCKFCKVPFNYELSKAISPPKQKGKGAGKAGGKAMAKGASMAGKGNTHFQNTHGFGSFAPKGAGKGKGKANIQSDEYFPNPAFSPAGQGNGTAEAGDSALAVVSSLAAILQASGIDSTIAGNIQQQVVKAVTGLQPKGQGKGASDVVDDPVVAAGDVKDKAYKALNKARHLVVEAQTKRNRIFAELEQQHKRVVQLTADLDSSREVFRVAAEQYQVAFDAAQLKADQEVAVDGLQGKPGGLSGAMQEGNGPNDEDLAFNEDAAMAPHLYAESKSFGPVPRRRKNEDATVGGGDGMDENELDIDGEVLLDYDKKKKQCVQAPGGEGGAGSGDAASVLFTPAKANTLWQEMQKAEELANASVRAATPEPKGPPGAFAPPANMGSCG